MNQEAAKAPTCQKDYPSVEARKTGRPTTNQTSRAPKRKSLAADNQLTAGLLEKSVVNLTLVFALPRPAGRDSTVPIRTALSPTAIAANEPINPSAVRRTPPMKKPAPLRAFLDPVRRATHLNSAPSSPSGTTTLMALLALILVRSLAIPDSAWAAIT